MSVLTNPVLTDLDHFWGGDLAPSPNRVDLGQVSGSDLTTRRILRRLMTNPGGGDYPWQPEYGVGLPLLIGGDYDSAQITGLIRSAIAAEPSVAQIPAPVITVTRLTGENGAAITITYQPRAATSPVTISFSLS